MVAGIHQAFADSVAMTISAGRDENERFDWRDAQNSRRDGQREGRNGSHDG